MYNIFGQGALDNLCGIYSVLNAEKIINNSTDEESQALFNSIIDYLSRKRMLKDVITQGVNHRLVTNIMEDVVRDRIPFRQTNKKNFVKLDDWWNYSKTFLEEKPNRCIILSLGGLYNHLTVIESMSERRLFLRDSSGVGYIRKMKSKLVSKKADNPNKNVVYPSQCWYLGRE